jgi:hypothetical protein
MQDLTPEQWQEIEKLIFASQKIQAIKLVREWTNLGLKESKEFVEAHEKVLRETCPEKMPVKTAGCGAASLIFLAFTLGIAMLYFAS